MARLAILDGPKWYDEINNQDWIKLNKERISQLLLDRGYVDKDIDITNQLVYSTQAHEYTLISQEEETVFVEDETGAPHVFTIEEWKAINAKKNDGMGFVMIAAIAAGLLLL